MYLPHAKADESLGFWAVVVAFMSQRGVVRETGRKVQIKFRTSFLKLSLIFCGTFFKLICEAWYVPYFYADIRADLFTLLHIVYSYNCFALISEYSLQNSIIFRKRTDYDDYSLIFVCITIRPSIIFRRRTDYDRILQ